MSQHWIYINSPGYRRFVEASKQKKWLLWGTTLALGGLGTLAANMVMNTTNPKMAEEGYKNKDEELAKLPMNAQVRLYATAASSPVQVDDLLCKLLPGHRKQLVLQEGSSSRCYLCTAQLPQQCSCLFVYMFDAVQVMARKQREHLKAMILDVTEGKDKARYKDLLK
jgi:hypothetical protein